MDVKKVITEKITNRDYEGIIALGIENNARVLRYVQMNIWGDYRSAQRWHAIEALHRLAEHFARDNDEAYRNVIRRALWAMNDESGNVPWAAPEMMAAVIKASPEQFAEFIPMLITNGLDNEMCHLGVLWSAGYLGRAHLAQMERFIPKLLPFLDNADGELRGYAVWAFNQLQYGPAQPKIKQLREDSAVVILFEEGVLKYTTVGAVAQESR